MVPSRHNGAPHHDLHPAADSGGSAADSGGSAADSGGSAADSGGSAAVEDQQQTVEDQQQTVEDQQQTVEDQQQTVEDQQQTVEDQQQTVEDQQQTVEDQQQTVEDQQQTVLEEVFSPDYNITQQGGRYSAVDRTTFGAISQSRSYTPSTTCLGTCGGQPVGYILLQQGHRHQQLDTIDDVVRVLVSRTTTNQEDYNTQDKVHLSDLLYTLVSDPSQRTDKCVRAINDNISRVLQPLSVVSDGGEQGVVTGTKCGDDVEQGVVTGTKCGDDGEQGVVTNDANNTTVGTSNVTCEANNVTGEANNVTCETNNVTGEANNVTCEANNVTCEANNATCEANDKDRHKHIEISGERGEGDDHSYVRHSLPPAPQDSHTMLGGVGRPSLGPPPLGAPSPLGPPSLLGGGPSPLGRPALGGGRVPPLGGQLTPLVPIAAANRGSPSHLKPLRQSVAANREGEGNRRHKVDQPSSVTSDCPASPPKSILKEPVLARTGPRRATPPGVDRLLLTQSRETKNIRFDFKTDELEFHSSEEEFDEEEEFEEEEEEEEEEEGEDEYEYEEEEEFDSEADDPEEEAILRARGVIDDDSEECGFMLNDAADLLQLTSQPPSHKLNPLPHGPDPWVGANTVKSSARVVQDSRDPLKDFRKQKEETKGGAAVKQQDASKGTTLHAAQVPQSRPKSAATQVSGGIKPNTQESQTGNLKLATPHTSSTPSTAATKETKIDKVVEGGKPSSTLPTKTEESQRQEARPHEQRKLELEGGARNRKTNPMDRVVAKLSGRNDNRDDSHDTVSTDRGRPEASTPSGSTDRGRPKASAPSGSTDRGRPEASAPSGSTDRRRPEASAPSGSTDRGRPEVSAPSGSTDRGRPEASAPSGSTDRGRPEASAPSGSTDRGRPEASAPSGMVKNVTVNLTKLLVNDAESEEEYSVNDGNCSHQESRVHQDNTMTVAKVLEVEEKKMLDVLAVEVAALRGKLSKESQATQEKIKTEHKNFIQKFHEEEKKKMVENKRRIQLQLEEENKKNIEVLRNSLLKENTEKKNKLTKELEEKNNEQFEEMKLLFVQDLQQVKNTLQKDHEEEMKELEEELRQLYDQEQRTTEDKINTTRSTLLSRRNDVSAATSELEHSLAEVLRVKELDIKSQHTKQLNILEAKLDEELEMAARRAEEKETLEKKNHSVRLAKMKQQHEQELQHVQELCKLMRKEVEDQHELDLTKLKSDFKAELTLQKTELENKLTEFKIEYEERMNSLEHEVDDNEEEREGRESGKTEGRCDDVRENGTNRDESVRSDNRRISEEERKNHQILREKRERRRILERELDELKAEENKIIELNNQKLASSGSHCCSGSVCVHESKYNKIKHKYTNLVSRIKSEKAKKLSRKLPTTPETVVQNAPSLSSDRSSTESNANVTDSCQPSNDITSSATSSPPNIRSEASDDEEMKLASQVLAKYNNLPEYNNSKRISLTALDSHSPHNNLTSTPREAWLEDDLLLHGRRVLRKTEKFLKSNRLKNPRKVLKATAEDMRREILRQNTDFEATPRPKVPLRRLHPDHSGSLTSDTESDEHTHNAPSLDSTFGLDQMLGQ
ncbi:uncharacterized protein LOC121861142 [Homarus americanus]|uniref:uncharacterized protein LOC121861142 n=1 Tax=Homarus americanus TaxID=6706 RepID=UPI001C47A6AA|nr:uncharacterized protein LOC121861142 [Homarus americanus]